MTYVSADGSFGGPVAVAIAQASALSSLGHDVTLVGGWDGEAEVDLPDVDVQLSRVPRPRPPAGFAGLWTPGLEGSLRKSLGSAEVAHIHYGRDLVSARAATIAHELRRGLVLQTHGMVVPDSRWRVRFFDRVLGRSSLLSSDRVLALTPAEEQSLHLCGVAPDAISRIGNAVPDVPDATLERAEPEVLFLARLHPRKRVRAFIEMAEQLIRSGLTAQFVVVGPDEGDLSIVLDAASDPANKGRIVYEGVVAPGAGVARLARASVMVLPSVGEVVPMSVLESLSVGTPVVITSDCGLAPAVQASGAGVVTDGSPSALAASVAGLLNEESRRLAAAARGRELVATCYSTAALARALVEIYSSILDAKRGGAD